MFDVLTVLVIGGTFLIAGTVKGVVGFGLPTVSLALLTLAIGLPQAMALLLVPSLVTNLWQAAAGGQARAILRRIWPFLLTATATVWLGAMALTRVDVAVLTGLLGVLLVVYATVILAGLRLTVTPPQEIWVGPLVGLANGVLTGMTGSFVVPGVLFLQAIGLSRDRLIQAMGMLFAASTMALGVALQGSGFLTVDLGKLSAVALVPAVIGMILGQRIRRMLPEDLFRRVFLAALLMLGAYIFGRAVGVFS